MDAKFSALLGVTEARLDATLQKGLRQQMGWMILMWITTIAALILRTE